MSILPTLGETLKRSARKYPESDAIVYPKKDIRWTYREFDEKVTRFANALRSHGIGGGDVVSVFLHNSAEFAVAVYGIVRAGAIFNPVNFRLAPGELTYIVTHSGSTALVFEEETRDTVEQARSDLDVENFVYVDDDLSETPAYANGFYGLCGSASDTPPDVDDQPDDIYGIIYTSGTTGRPKGVVHTHEHMTYFNLLYAGELRLGRKDHGVLLMPMYHASGLHGGLFMRINLGSKTVILHDFDSDLAIKMMERERVTHAWVASRAWSDMLRSARELGYDNSDFGLAIFGGESMPQSLLEECREAFTDNFVTPYGMTEFGPAAVFPTAEDVRERPGTVGHPAPNHEMRVVEPTESEDPNDPVTPTDEMPAGETGEIILRGPCMMTKYWKEPEKTAAAIRDGWYFTGDTGRIDEDGYLYLVDRVDDMIISGGENIYPAEVENVLYQHESVAEVAVVGLDDDEWGEIVTAFVVPDEEVSSETLDDYCREHPELADFKRPRRYAFVSELPSIPSGKIQRFRLRERGNTGEYEVTEP